MRACIVLGSVVAAAFVTATLEAASPPSLEWMAGSWSGSLDGVEMEELWTSEKAGSLLGLHRDVAKGRTVSFEFLRIEVTPDGATYWASPLGRPATPFRRVDGDAHRVVFENSEHAYPTRILYWLWDDGTLHARIEGTRGGKPASEEWSWRPAPAIRP